VTSGGNNFNDFPENQLPKFQQIGMAPATKFQTGMAAAIPAIPLPAPLHWCRLTIGNPQQFRPIT